MSISLYQTFQSLGRFRRGARGDLAEVELDQSGVIVTVAALRGLEDLGTEVAWELAPGAAGPATDRLLQLGQIGLRDLTGPGLRVARGAAGRMRRLRRPTAGPKSP